MNERELKQRLHASATRLMRSDDGKRPLNGELAETVGKLYGQRWYRDRAYAIGDTGRLSVEPEARKQAFKAAKRLGQMINGNADHGPETKAHVRKTLDRLRRQKLTVEALQGRCRAFGKLRKAEARHRAETAVPSVEPIQFPRWTMRARWLRPKDVHRVGQDMGNCLANGTFDAFYRDRLVDGALSLVLLEADDGTKLALFGIESDGGEVSEFQLGDETQGFALREMIIDFLAKTSFAMNGCEALLDLGICDEQIRHRKAGGTDDRLMIDGKCCEFGKDFAVFVEGTKAIVLRSTVCAAQWPDPCRFVGFDDGDTYMARAKHRGWMRRTYAADPEFAAACETAFADAPEPFRFDWLGVD